ncbi:uncharacterized protein LOC117784631 [Drosophila innubila]|uniref:uncharacterized protein LOC117784631 n=1 Tax=Drosophila innubila TaxID=198719 RepID=UPI00148BA7A1|nr:uncharacterized protein LOC117784631 [Drosophila innubila]
MPKVRRSRKPQPVKEQVFEGTLEEPVYCTDGSAHWSLVHSLDSIDKRMAILSDQYKSLLDDLAEQKVLITQLLNGRAYDTDLGKKFPILSKNALIQINDDIETGDRNSYINVMRQLLLPKGVRKNLRNIIADNVTMQYNIDGILGKEPLKALEHFYNALLKSIETDGVGSPEEKLRNAMQLQKKRVIKSQNKNKRKVIYKEEIK